MLNISPYWCVCVCVSHHYDAALRFLCDLCGPVFRISVCLPDLTTLEWREAHFLLLCLALMVSDLGGQSSIYFESHRLCDLQQWGTQHSFVLKLSRLNVRR